MASHTPDAATMAQLPDTALVTILQAVPQGHRLRHCAAVSTAWAAAAASATTHVTFHFHSARLAAFQAWLDKHAGQLVTLRTTGGSSVGQASELRAAAAVSALLRCLPQLSELQLERMAMTDATLAPLSTLAHLQSLSISDNGASFAALWVVNALPQLTALHLGPGRGNTMFPAPKLQDDDSDSDTEAWVSEGDPTAFLGALAQCTRLVSVELVEPLGSAPVDVNAFEALTASSHISSLKLSSGRSGPEWRKGMVLPRGALRHAFAAGRLLHMCELLVEYSGYEQSFSESPDNWCVDAADLDAVAAACPGLRSLSLRHVLRRQPQAASSLARLRQVTRLELADSTGCLTDEAAATLSQMRGLRQLVVLDAGSFTLAGLRHMTALSQLTRLFTRHCGLVSQLSGPWGVDHEFALENLAASKGYPDVSWRLRQFLASGKVVALLRVQELEKHVQALQETEFSLRRELAKSRRGEEHAQQMLAHQEALSATQAETIGLQQERLAVQQAQLDTLMEDRADQRETVAAQKGIIETQNETIGLLEAQLEMLRGKG